jgi:CTP:molybdopterin cytidylyltransferase MocA
MTAGLVLAAGGGSRFDAGFKLLADLDGRPLVEYAISAQCAVPELVRVVVVLGAHADQVLARVELGRAEAVICPEWADGMSASLRAGVAALGGAGAERVLVTLGDAPTVTPAVIRRLLEAPDGARATYGGRPGHPVILGRRQLEQVPSLAGDAGARSLLAGAALVECGDLALGTDVDTAEDLRGLAGRVARDDQRR